MDCCFSTVGLHTIREEFVNKYKEGIGLKEELVMKRIVRIGYWSLELLKKAEITP